MNETQSNKLKVFAWNPNGIRAVLRRSEEDLINFIKNYSPDILFLIETKMNANEKIEKEVTKNLERVFLETTKEKYKVKWSHCQRPGRHGTGLVYKSNIDIKSFEYGIEDSQPNEIEGRVLSIETSRAHFIGLYVVNAGPKLKRLDYKREWSKKLHAYLNSKRSADKPVFVLGDLNVAKDWCDLANPGSNSKTAGFSKEEREDFKRLLESGWIDTYRDANPVEDPSKSLGKDGIYTFWNTKSRARERNAGWRIDYVLVDKEHYSKKFVEEVFIIGDVKGSDHCPVGVTINFDEI